MMSIKKNCVFEYFSLFRLMCVDIELAICNVDLTV